MKKRFSLPLQFILLTAGKFIFLNPVSDDVTSHLKTFHGSNLLTNRDLPTLKCQERQRHIVRAIDPVQHTFLSANCLKLSGLCWGEYKGRRRGNWASMETQIRSKRWTERCLRKREKAE